MKALIIGAGIGGLVAALQMHAEGIDVELFDSVSELKALGLGITLQPHATRELARLGLLDDLVKVSVSVEKVEYRTADSKMILTDLRGLKAGYEYPQLLVHRGELQMLLLKAFHDRVGAHKLHLAHHFHGFQQDEKKVTAHFVNKEGGHWPEYHGDLLIGADGVKSVTRTQLHPYESPMSFKGVMMWRGGSYQQPFADGRTIAVCGDSKVQLVLYPISNPDREGKVFINWLVEVLDPHATKLHSELWNRPGRIQDFMHHFRNWNLDFIDLKKLFQETHGILEYPMVDRDPLPFWSQGRVTLLGDAAHPMYPHGGNGASQAMVDAHVIVECLAKHTADIPAALKAYENERLPTNFLVVQDNRQRNQAAILKLIEQSCDGKCGKVHRCVHPGVLDKLINSYKHGAGFSVEQVNKH